MGLHCPVLLSQIVAHLWMKTGLHLLHKRTQLGRNHHIRSLSSNFWQQLFLHTLELPHNRRHLIRLIPFSRLIRYQLLLRLLKHHMLCLNSLPISTSKLILALFVYHGGNYLEAHMGFRLPPMLSRSQCFVNFDFLWLQVLMNKMWIFICKFCKLRSVDRMWPC